MSLEPYKVGTLCKIKGSTREVTIIEAIKPTITYSNTGNPPVAQVLAYRVTGGDKETYSSSELEPLTVTIPKKP